MFTPSFFGKSTLQKWIRKSLLGLTLLILGLVLLGTTYQALGTRFDRQTFAPPGELIDMGGYRLHLFCQGEGTPIVILESGLSATVAMWTRIQRGLAKTTQVCAYDRAGIGWSESNSAEPDAEHIAQQLHTLLHKANLQGSFVVVGHSMGGLFARAYSATFPNQVAGLVLLDAVHPDQGQGLSEKAQTQQQQFMQLLQWTPTLARLGVLRVASWFNRIAEELPNQAQAAHQALLITTKHLQATLDEANQWEKTTAQVRQQQSLGDIPLLVISAGTDEFGFGAQRVGQWQALQRDLTQLSDNSRYILIPQATHHSLLTDPEHATMTVAAIRRMVIQVRINSNKKAKGAQ
jgi:pimeloyl-ACP methyl ester carboxylesterase